MRRAPKFISRSKSIRSRQKGVPTIAVFSLPARLLEARGHRVAVAMKRSRSAGALVDIPVNAASPVVRPQTPGVGVVCGAEENQKRTRRGYASCASAHEDARTLEMVRAAACASGEHEVLRYIQTMPFPMNERVELALLELNVLMRIHKASLGRIHLKASHAWTRGEPARVVALVEHAVRDARVTDALKHLVCVAFPSCASLAAAQHVFAVPTFLRQWHERNFGGGDVRVLEVTMRDADGADANAVYFPMG